MKTTKADFELFKAYCAEAIQRLGLLEWSVHYAHKHLDGDYATTAWLISGGVATVTLSTNWDDLRPKTEQAIRRVAYHEVMHLAVAPLIAEAQDRYTSQTAIDIAEHQLIRRLENVIV